MPVQPNATNIPLIWNIAGTAPRLVKDARRSAGRWWLDGIRIESLILYTMSVRTGRYFKALILMLAFSANSVMGFACSVSSYIHASHHSVSATDGQSTRLHHHGHGDAGHHHAGANDHADQNKKQERPADCCSEKMVAIDMLDKAVSRSVELPVFTFTSPGVFITMLTPSLPNWVDRTTLPYHLRWRLPGTIQDLRIVIQSFQI
jgi:hypothetical protein